MRDERALGSLVHGSAEMGQIVSGGVPQVLARVADLGEQVVHREGGCPGEHVLS